MNMNELYVVPDAGVKVWPTSSHLALANEECLFEIRAEMENDNVCSVCGRGKSSFHYGANVCDPCRSFFRRGARGVPCWTCPFQNCCNIVDSNGRACCKKCRYEKCLAVGMRREAVQRQRDSIKHRKRIRKAQYKRKQCIIAKRNNAIDTSKTQVAEHEENTSRCKNTKETVALVATPAKQLQVYLKDESMRLTETVQLAVDFERDLCEGIRKARFCHVSNFPSKTCSANSGSNVLTLKVLSSKEPGVLNSILKEQAIRIMELVKPVDAFSARSIESQVSLLRSFVPCVVVLHDVQRSKCFEDHLLLLDHRTIIPRPKTNNVDIIFDALLPAFQRSEPDEVEFALLLCISLWNPDVCCNEDKQIVRDLRFRYLETLEWYVFRQLVNSCGRHGSLVMISTMLERFRRCLALGMRHVPNLDPLVKEIFSIIDLSR